MPELPEVETIARALRPELIGKTILDVNVRWPRTVAAPSVRKFKELIKGRMITGVARRAKYLIIQLQPVQESHSVTYNLMIHLRMSGDLSIREDKIKPEKHDRLILRLSAHKNSGDGGYSNLVFNDTRKFGRVWLTSNIDEVLGRLGPEPFGDEFTPQWLYQNLSSRHRQLKPLLLDQTFIAGLGNIYTDECLHMAKLHPLTLSNTLKPKQAAALHQAIRAVLEEGIRRNGASIDWVYRGGEYQNHFRVYDRAGQACPVCGRKIQKLVIGQRGTHICPNCQKLR
jgi:formamidopyrimidine-DNA glycosylase